MDKTAADKFEDKKSNYKVSSLGSGLWMPRPSFCHGIRGRGVTWVKRNLVVAFLSAMGRGGRKGVG